MTLDILISCDADPDRPEYGGYEQVERVPRHTWFGLNNAPRAEVPKITWFLRSDYNAHHDIGDWCVPPDHELAWHCHFWRWSEKHHAWYQETRDITWMLRCLEQGWRAIGERNVTAFRSGWAYHNLHTLNWLCEHGIEAEVSSVPDMVNTSRTEQGLPVDCMNWLGSPQEPYYIGDMLVIPNSTYPYSSLKTCTRFLSGFPRIGIRRRGFASIASHPVLFSRVADEALRKVKRGGRALLASYFHPDAFLVREIRHRETEGNFRENLRYLLDCACAEGIALRWWTATEYARAYRRGETS
jgi:hypothetical protein